MHRFFVPPGAISHRTVTLPPETARQVTRVLRMRPGDHITVFDGSGAEWAVELLETASSQVVGRVTGESRPAVEPATALTLWQGLLDQAQFEWLLQKGTELGVARFVPLITERVQGSRSDGPSPRRLDRWRRIIREAAEQSGRVLLPALADPVRLTDAQPAADGPALVLWENEARTGLRDALAHLVPGRPSCLSLVVGPKGGLTTWEVDALRERGAELVSLGPRLLRGETAALAAVTAVLHDLGQLAPPA